MTKTEFLLNLGKCKTLSPKLVSVLSKSRTISEVKHVIEAVQDAEYSQELDWLYSTLNPQIKEIILIF